MRDRSEIQASSKRFEYIAPEEFAVAIEHVIKLSYGMKREDIPPVVSKILGFQRTTDEMRSTIENVIDNLLRVGRLTAQNEHLQIAES